MSEGPLAARAPAAAMWEKLFHPVDADLYGVVGDGES